MPEKRYHPFDGSLIDNGERLEARDCRRCGRPVLVGRYYGGHPEFGAGGEVVLDALPLRAFRITSQYRKHVLEDDRLLYSQHACVTQRRSDGVIAGTGDGPALDLPAC